MNQAALNTDGGMDFREGPAVFHLDHFAEAVIYFNRLFKNAHLLCCAHPSSLQRTETYASFLRISRAVHLEVFEPPGINYFFSNLLMPGQGAS
jgi:hypothetical protein